MKKLFLLGMACLVGVPCLGQISYFNQGFLRQPDAATDRAYLGVTNSSGGGSGTVTNFSSGNLSPLFTTSVASPTTSPVLSYSLISQSPNTVFAGPASGGSGTPSFRSLVTADIPGLSGFVVSITNADFAGTPPDISIITASNAPIPSLKALKAGGNVTLTDNGTSVTIAAANSGGGASGIDLTQTNMPPFDGKTNWYIDFTYPAQVFNATGAIFLNYATNWGLANTSRVVNVYIPPTNYFRPVYFINQATNWHQQVRSISAVPTGYGAKISFQIFGQLDTNVCYTPFIDNTVTGTNWLTVNGFNPTNSQGGCVFWLDASAGQVFQDEFGTVPAASDGMLVRSATDLSKTFGLATNGATTTFLFYRGPNTSVGNIPAFNFTQGGPAWLVTSNFSADLPQTNWAFMMFYGRGTGLVFLDGLSEGHRFACLPSESALVSALLYSGSSLTYTPASALKWQLFSFQQSTTSSSIRTNGVQAVSGNSGTQGPGRFTVGSDYPLDNFTGNVYLSELLIYRTNLTLVQVTNIENYFRVKYGAW